MGVVHQGPDGGFQALVRDDPVLRGPGEHAQDGTGRPHVRAAHVQLEPRDSRDAPVCRMGGADESGVGRELAAL